MTKDHSDAFEKFIADKPDDLEGMIAYALYKKQKREFISKKGLSSDDIRIKEYHLDLNDSRIEMLRETAQNMLNSYAATIVEITREDIYKNVIEGVLYDEIKSQYELYSELSGKSNQELTLANKTIKEGLSDVSDKISKANKAIETGTAWWKSVLAGVAASFVFGLVLTYADVIGWTNPFKSSPPAKTSPTDAPATPPRQ